MCNYARQGSRCLSVPCSRAAAAPACPLLLSYRHRIKIKIKITNPPKKTEINNIA